MILKYSNKAISFFFLTVSASIVNMTKLINSVVEKGFVTFVCYIVITYLFCITHRMLILNNTMLDILNIMSCYMIPCVQNNIVWTYYFELYVNAQCKVTFCKHFSLINPFVVTLTRLIIILKYTKIAYTEILGTYFSCNPIHVTLME